MEPFFTELDYTNIEYKISKQDSKLIIEHEYKLKIDAAVYDSVTENYVFAVKADTGNCTYEVDYFFFSKDLELLKILRENVGVNPSFIVSPNKEIWVGLTITTDKIKKNGEIILPLFGRNRIEELIIKRDTGMEYFEMKGQSYGYIVDNWGRGKEDKLVIYQYDKNNLFKNRKAVKLKGMYSCMPIIINDTCYVSDCDSSNNYSTKIYEIDAKGNLMEAYASEGVENCSRPYILDITDKNIIMIASLRDRVDCLSFSLAGILEDRKTIFEADKGNDIYAFQMYSMYNGTVIRFFTNQTPIAILYKNRIFEKYESDGPFGLEIKAVSDECIYAHGSPFEYKRIEISKIM